MQGYASNPHSLQFNGLHSHVIIPGNDFNPDRDLMFEMWFYPKQLVHHQTYTLLSKDMGTASGTRYTARISRQHLAVGVWGTEREFFKEIITPIHVNTLYHLAFRFIQSQNRYEIYLNSKEVASGQMAVTNRSVNNGALNIGRDNRNTLHFNGMIDEIRIWENPLPTPLDIRRSAHATVDRDTEGLIGYWPFDEGEEFIAYDQTPYENNGTILHTTWAPGIVSLANYFEDLTGSVQVSLLSDTKEITGEVEIPFVEGAADLKGEVFIYEPETRYIDGEITVVQKGVNDILGFVGVPPQNCMIINSEVLPAPTHVDKNTAIKDATLWSRIPHINFGSNNELMMGSSMTEVYRTIVGFDLSNFELIEEENYDLEDIRLNFRGTTTTAGETEFRLYRTNNSWAEHTVNWINQPLMKDLVATAIGDRHGLSFDITEYIIEAKNNGLQEVSFVIISEDPNSPVMTYAAKEMNNHRVPSIDTTYYVIPPSSGVANLYGTIISRAAAEKDLLGSVVIEGGYDASFITGELLVPKRNRVHDITGTITPVITEYAFLEGEVEIPKFDMELDILEGSVTVPLLNNKDDLELTVTIPKIFEVDDLSGEIEIPRIDDEKDIEGSILIAAYGYKEIESEITVPVIEGEEDLEGSIVSRAIGHEFLEGALDIPFIEDANDLEGDVEIPQIFALKDLISSFDIMNKESNSDIESSIDIPKIDSNKDIECSINVAAYYDKDIEGSINIPSQESENDLEGSIDIGKTESEKDLTGSLEIEKFDSNKDIESVIDIPVIERESDIEGDILVSAKGNNDIESSIDVPKLEEHKDILTGDLTVFAYGNKDIEGEIDVPRYDDHKDIVGFVTTYEYGEKDFGGEITIPEIHDLKDLSGHVLVPYEIEGTITPRALGRKHLEGSVDARAIWADDMYGFLIVEHGGGSDLVCEITVKRKKISGYGFIM